MTTPARGEVWRRGATHERKDQTEQRDQDFMNPLFVTARQAAQGVITGFALFSPRHAQIIWGEDQRINEHAHGAQWEAALRKGNTNGMALNAGKC